MRTTTRQSSLLTTLLSFMLGLIIWIFLAPTQLGGQVSYVIVDGNSMETIFHRGDLVLVRTASAYQIGDAVTYKNAELGRPVFHRIVQLDLDHFILKGDNNTWFDSYHPTADEIVGKLWVHIPRLGKAIEWLRLPLHVALAVSLFGGILMSNMLMRKPAQGQLKSSPLLIFGGIPEAALYAFGILTLVFFGLGIYAFMHPLTKTAEGLSYEQKGTFFYSAAGAPDIYDTNVVHSGEPVFPKLTCFLNVGFAYNLQSSQLQGISGKQQLFARVMDPESGWQRILPMNAETAFAGNSYMTLATLNICQVEALIGLVEQETGLHQSIYTLEIVPHVDMTASSAGNQIQDTFEPTLAFRFDKVHFFLATDSNKPDPLNMTKEGLSPGSTVASNSLSFLGLTPDVGTVRTIALLGFVLSLSGLLAAGLYFYNTAQRSPQTMIQLKYGALMMDVHERVFEHLAQTIDVRRIDDLAKIAERQNTMILHMTHQLTDYYLVQGPGMTYRFVLGDQKESTARVEEPVHQEIMQYMMRNNVKTVIDSMPTQEVIYQDIRPASCTNTSGLEPDEKVMLRYSMNISKSHSKS